MSILTSFVKDRHYAKYGTSETEFNETERQLKAGEQVSYEKRLKFFLVGLDGNLELAKKAAEAPELPGLKNTIDEE
jgi:hypothetical protein